VTKEGVGACIREGVRGVVIIIYNTGFFAGYIGSRQLKEIAS
jgi:hypothetical protein